MIGSNIHKIPSHYVGNKLYIFAIFGIDIISALIFLTIFVLLLAITQSVYTSIIIGLIILVSLLIKVQHEWFKRKNFSNKIGKETYEMDEFYEDSSIRFKPGSFREGSSFLELSTAVSLSLSFYWLFLSDHLVSFELNYIHMVFTLIMIFSLLSIFNTLYFTFVRTRGVIVKYKGKTLVKYVMSDYIVGTVLSSEISSVTVENDELHVNTKEPFFLRPKLIEGEGDGENIVVNLDNPEEAKDHINKYRTLESI